MGTVHTIIREELKTRKICAKFVPRVLRVDQKDVVRSRMNRASVFEWHKRFKEGRESVRDNERCERDK